MNNSERVLSPFRSMFGEGNVSIIAGLFACAFTDAPIPVLLWKTKFKYGLELKILAGLQMQADV